MRTVPASVAADVGLATQPVAELDHVSRTFDDTSRTCALQPMSLTIRTGEYMAITGPSGSGKSTLLNLLGLLDRPSTGSYRLCGRDASAMGDLDLTAMRGRFIGFVFQSFHLLAHKDAVENVSLPSVYRRSRRAEREAAATEVLHRVGLGHRLGARPTTMSGGERQRVAIARAIVNRPALLLCDEPTGNLDSSNTASVLDLLDELHERDNLTIVVVTHDPAVARRAGCQVRMNDGRVDADPAS